MIRSLHFRVSTTSKNSFILHPRRNLWGNSDADKLRGTAAMVKKKMEKVLNKPPIPKSAPPTVPPSVLPSQELINVFAHPSITLKGKSSFGLLKHGFLGHEPAMNFEILSGKKIVGYVEEEDTLFNSLLRWIWSSRRSMSIVVKDENQKPVLKISRPTFLINSTLRVNEPNGEEIGEIKSDFRPLSDYKYLIFRRKRPFAYMNTENFFNGVKVKDREDQTFSKIDYESWRTDDQIFEYQHLCKLNFTPNHGKVMGIRERTLIFGLALSLEQDIHIDRTFRDEFLLNSIPIGSSNPPRPTEPKEPPTSSTKKIDEENQDSIVKDSGDAEESEWSFEEAFGFTEEELGPDSGLDLPDWGVEVGDKGSSGLLDVLGDTVSSATEFVSDSV